VSEVCLPRMPMSFYFLSLGVDPSNSVASYLLVAHDETAGQVASCNDDYKFDVFLYSIL